MASFELTCYNLLASPRILSVQIPAPPYYREAAKGNGIQGRTKILASKSGGGFSLGSMIKRCEICGGQGAIECAGCKGTGRNKKNGNIFERWKCFDCQGFGMKSCPVCGNGGLTPEQRGER